MPNFQIKLFECSPINSLPRKQPPPTPPPIQPTPAPQPKPFIPKETPSDQAIADAIENDYLGTNRKLKSHYAEIPLPDEKEFSEIKQNVNSRLDTEIRTNCTLRKFLIDQRDKAKASGKPIKYFKIIGTRALKMSGSHYQEKIFDDAGMKSVREAGSANFAKEPHDTDIRTHFSKKFREGKTKISLSEVRQLKKDAFNYIGEVRSVESWYDPNSNLSINTPKDEDIDYGIGIFGSFNLFNNTCFHIAIDAESLDKDDLIIKLKSKDNRHRQAFTEHALGIMSDEDAETKNYSSIIGYVSNMIRGKKSFDNGLFQTLIKNHFDYAVQQKSWTSAIERLITNDVLNHVENNKEAVLLELLQFELLLEDAPDNIKNTLKPFMKDVWLKLFPDNNPFNHKILELRKSGLPATTIAAIIQSSAGLQLGSPGRSVHMSGNLTPFLTEQNGSPAIELQFENSLKLYVKWDPAALLHAFEIHPQLSDDAISLIAATCPLAQMASAPDSALERYKDELPKITPDVIQKANEFVQTGTLAQQFAGLSVLVQAYALGQTEVEEVLFCTALPRLMFCENPTLASLAKTSAKELLLQKTPKHIQIQLANAINSCDSLANWLEVLAASGVKSYVGYAAKLWKTLPDISPLSQQFVMQLLNWHPNEAIECLHLLLEKGQTLEADLAAKLKSLIASDKGIFQWYLLLDISSRQGVDLGISDRRPKHKDYKAIAWARIEQCRIRPSNSSFLETIELLTSKQITEDPIVKDKLWNAFLDLFQQLPDRLVLFTPRLYSSLISFMTQCIQQRPSDVEHPLVLFLLEQQLKDSSIPMEKLLKLIDVALEHKCKTVIPFLPVLCMQYLTRPGVPVVSFVPLLKKALELDPKQFVNRNPAFIFEFAKALFHDKEYTTFGKLSEDAVTVLINLVDALLIGAPNLSLQPGWEFFRSKLALAASRSMESELHHANARLACQELTHDYFLDALSLEILENNERASKTFLLIFSAWNKLNNGQQQRLGELAVKLFTREQLPTRLKDWLENGQSMGDAWIRCVLATAKRFPKETKWFLLLKRQVQKVDCKPSPATADAIVFLLNGEFHWRDLEKYYPHVREEDKAIWSASVKEEFLKSNDEQKAKILLYPTCPSNVLEYLPGVIEKLIENNASNLLTKVIDRYDEKLSKATWNKVWEWTLRNKSKVVEPIFNVWNRHKRAETSRAITCMALLSPKLLAKGHQPDLLKCIKALELNGLKPNQIAKIYVNCIVEALDRNQTAAHFLALELFSNYLDTQQSDDLKKQATGWLFNEHRNWPVQIPAHLIAFLVELHVIGVDDIKNVDKTLEWLLSVQVENVEKSEYEQSIQVILLSTFSHHYKKVSAQITDKIWDLISNQRERILLHQMIVSALARICILNRPYIKEAEKLLKKIVFDFINDTVESKEPDLSKRLTAITLFIKFATALRVVDYSTYAIAFKIIKVLINILDVDRKTTEFFSEFQKIFFTIATVFKDKQRSIQFEFCKQIVHLAFDDAVCRNIQWTTLSEVLSQLAISYTGFILEAEKNELHSILEDYFFHRYFLTPQSEEFLTLSLKVLITCESSRTYTIQSFVQLLRILIVGDGFDFDADLAFKNFNELVSNFKKKYPQEDIYTFALHIYSKLFGLISQGNDRPVFYSRCEKLLEYGKDSTHTKNFATIAFLYKFVEFHKNSPPSSFNEKFLLVRFARSALQQIQREAANVAPESLNSISFEILNYSLNTILHLISIEGMSPEENTKLSTAFLGVLDSVFTISVTYLEKSKNVETAKIFLLITSLFTANPIIVSHPASLPLFRRIICKYIIRLGKIEDKNLVKMFISLCLTKLPRTVFSGPFDLYSQLPPDQALSVGIACLADYSQFFSFIDDLLDIAKNDTAEKLNQSLYTAIEIASVLLNYLEPEKKWLLLSKFRTPFVMALNCLYCMEGPLHAASLFYNAHYHQLINFNNQEIKEFFNELCRAMVLEVRHNPNLPTSHHEKLLGLIYLCCGARLSDDPFFRQTIRLEKYLLNDLPLVNPAIRQMLTSILSTANGSGPGIDQINTLSLFLCESLLENHEFNEFSNMISNNKIFSAETRNRLYKMAIQYCVEALDPINATHWLKEFVCDTEHADPEVSKLASRILEQIIQMIVDGKETEPFASLLITILSKEELFVCDPDWEALIKLCRLSSQIPEEHVFLKQGLLFATMKWVITRGPKEAQILSAIAGVLLQGDIVAMQIIQQSGDYILTLLMFNNQHETAIEFFNHCAKHELPLHNPIAYRACYLSHGLTLGTRKDDLIEVAEYTKSYYDNSTNEHYIDSIKCRFALEVAISAGQANKEDVCISWTKRFVKYISLLPTGKLSRKLTLELLQVLIKFPENELTLQIILELCLRRIHPTSVLVETTSNILSQMTLKGKQNTVINWFVEYALTHHLYDDKVLAIIAKLLKSAKPSLLQKMWRVNLTLSSPPFMLQLMRIAIEKNLILENPKIEKFLIRLNSDEINSFIELYFEMDKKGLWSPKNTLKSLVELRAAVIDPTQAMFLQDRQLIQNANSSEMMDELLPLIQQSIDTIPPEQNHADIAENVIAFVEKAKKFPVHDTESLQRLCFSAVNTIPVINHCQLALYFLEKNFGTTGSILFDLGNVANHKNNPYFAKVLKGLIEFHPADWDRNLSLLQNDFLPTQEYKKLLHLALSSYLEREIDIKDSILEQRLDMIIHHIDNIPAEECYKMIKTYVRHIILHSDPLKQTEYAVKLYLWADSVRCKPRKAPENEALEHGKLAISYWNYNRRVAVELLSIEECLQYSQIDFTRRTILLEQVYKQFEVLSTFRVKDMPLAVLHAYLHIAAAPASYFNQEVINLHRSKCIDYFKKLPAVFRQGKFEYLNAILLDYDKLPGTTTDEQKKNAINLIFDLMPRKIPDWDYFSMKAYSLLMATESYKKNEDSFIQKFVILLQDATEMLMTRDLEFMPKTVLIFLGKILQASSLDIPRLDRAFTETVLEFFKAYMDAILSIDFNTVEGVRTEELLSFVFTMIAGAFNAQIYRDPRHAPLYFEFVENWIKLAPFFLRSYVKTRNDITAIYKHLFYTTGLIALDYCDVPTWKKVQEKSTKAYRVNTWLKTLNAIEGYPRYAAMVIANIKQLKGVVDTDNQHIVELSVVNQAARGIFPIENDIIKDTLSEFSKPHEQIADWTKANESTTPLLQNTRKSITRRKSNT